jgi:protein TonB
MLNVLLESKAQHTRRIGGTLTSALVHGAIITTAVLLTVQPEHGIVREPLGPPPVYVPTNPPSEPAPTPRTPVSPRTSESSPTPSISLPPMEPVSTTIPSVETNLAPIAQGNVPIGPGLPLLTGAPPTLGAPTGTGEAMEARYVEKPPRVLRSENPRFPEALRARGLGGRIVVQFVVDTLGRAEMSEFKVVDATDAQLADPVRAVLPRFRFTPGEAAGHKVRTLVALPFDFTVVR